MGRLAGLIALVCLAGVAVAASTAPSIAQSNPCMPAPPPVCGPAKSSTPDANGNFVTETKCIFTAVQQSGINCANNEWLDYPSPFPPGATIVDCPLGTVGLCYIPANSTNVSDLKVVPKEVSAFISITDPNAPAQPPQVPFAVSFTCTDGNALVQPVNNATQQLIGIKIPAPTGPSDTFCFQGYDDTQAGWNITIEYVVGSPLPQWKTDLRKKNLGLASDGFGVGGMAASGVALIPGVGPGAVLGLGLTSILAGGVGVFTGHAAADPVDPNFTVVVTPTPPNVDVSSFGPATAQLIRSLEQAMALAAAIDTTQNRATTALLASDSASQQLQVTALAGFESQLDPIVNQLPAQFAAYGQELLSQGVDTTTITPTQIATLQSLLAGGLTSNLQTAANTVGIDATTQQEIAALLANADPGQVESLLLSRFNSGPLAPPVLPAANNLPLVAAVLPASRSAVVGNPVTAFATIINTGTSTASKCGIAPDATLPLPIDFSYQTTDPATNALTGTLNTPVDIGPGGAQSFVIAETPTASFPTVFSELLFFCANANVAPQLGGLNTLVVSASTTATPDVVALAASGDPGIVDIPGNAGTGVFAVATVNVGASGSITASANTGSATLPVGLAICQTNPTTGTCFATPGSSVTTMINTGQTPTFGIFATGSGSVPFDPANNRVFVVFKDPSGAVRGETSVAVRTQ